MTTDPPIIWDTECLPCIPPAECPPPCTLPVFDKKNPEEEVTLDLRNPLYEDGVISTTERAQLIGRIRQIACRVAVDFLAQQAEARSAAAVAEVSR